MSLQFSPYAIPLFVAAAASTAFAWFALRRRHLDKALVFGLLMLALSWWSLCYALRICATDLTTQYFFNTVKYVGVILVPPLWLTLAAEHTQSRILTRRTLFLIFVPAMILLPIALSDPWTHLWWSGIWLAEFNGQAVMKSTHALPYYVNLIFGYLYVILGLWLYVRRFRDQGQIFRWQAVLMVTAAAMPVVANVVTQLGLSPIPWGLDSFFFTLGGALLAVALFRYRYLDIIPVASKAVIEQIPEGVIVLDSDGRIIDLNPAASALTGVDRDRVVGQPLGSAVNVPKLSQALLRMAELGTERAAACDVQLGQAGNQRALSLSTTPLSHASDEPIGQIILLNDISERVAARREVEALYQQAEIERQRLDLTIRTVSDAIVLLDTQGEILASNPTARQILNGDQRCQFPPFLQAVLDQAGSTDGKTQTEIEIGERCFHATAAPVPGTGLALTMHDVTHFRELAYLKDDFVRTVSHDLRTPLATIRGYTHLALLDRTSEHKRREALEQIDQAVTRMSDLISDLLALATLEAGVDGPTEPVRLDELARSAVQDLKETAQARGLDILLHLEDIPPLQANPCTIRQVWQNLIDNAVKYTDNGTITVRVQAADNQVLGQVSDTGIGISAADLPYVFDKFFRASSPYPREAVGTGLGLSLVKGIVERFGGRVWVESEVGIGSTFSFDLPLVQSREQRDNGSS